MDSRIGISVAPNVCIHSMASASISRCCVVPGCLSTLLQLDKCSGCSAVVNHDALDEHKENVIQPSDGKQLVMHPTGAARDPAPRLECDCETGTTTPETSFVVVRRTGAKFVSSPIGDLFARPCQPGRSSLHCTRQHVRMLCILGLNRDLSTTLETGHTLRSVPHWSSASHQSSELRLRSAFMTFLPHFFTWAQQSIA